MLLCSASLLVRGPTPLPAATAQTRKASSVTNIADRRIKYIPRTRTLTSKHVQHAYCYASNSPCHNSSTIQRTLTGTSFEEMEDGNRAIEQGVFKDVLYKRCQKHLSRCHKPGVFMASLRLMRVERYYSRPIVSDQKAGLMHYLSPFSSFCIPPHDLVCLLLNKTI